MSYLILVRHGRSKWNEKGLWTGFKDISLSRNGKNEAKKTARFLKDIKIDIAYTSDLKRAQETLKIILDILKLKIKIIKAKELKERNYGIYTGKNKWQVKNEIGEKKFFQLRRSWNFPIPRGESLKEVYQRVIPYYKKKIFPNLLREKNVLVVAHGNSLRALIKYLEKIPNNEVSEIELKTGEARIYLFDKKGKILNVENRSLNNKAV